MWSRSTHKDIICMFVTCARIHVRCPCKNVCGMTRVMWHSAVLTGLPTRVKPDQKRTEKPAEYHGYCLFKFELKEHLIPCPWFFLSPSNLWNLNMSIASSVHCVFSTILYTNKSVWVSVRVDLNRKPEEGFLLLLSCLKKATRVSGGWRYITLKYSQLLTNICVMSSMEVH